MHADGAGTKSVLAYALWRETGDMSVWEGIAQDALVMNLDDLMFELLLPPPSSLLPPPSSLLPSPFSSPPYILFPTLVILAPLQKFGGIGYICVCVHVMHNSIEFIFSYGVIRTCYFHYF